MTDIGISITPSHIIEYLFCPRFTYFEYVLCIPQNEEKYFKVMKGRNLHDLKLVRNKDYLRKKIGVVEKWEGRYLTNDYLRGEIDEVLKLEDGTMAPLDYKFAVYDDKIYETYKTQLFCYAILIEENFGIEVNRGFIVYIRSQNKLISVPVEKKDKNQVVEVAKEVCTIIQKNFYPKATNYKKRCVSCTYQNICDK